MYESTEMHWVKRGLLHMKEIINAKISHWATSAFRANNSETGQASNSNISDAALDIITQLQLFHGNS